MSSTTRHGKAWPSLSTRDRTERVRNATWQSRIRSVRRSVKRASWQEIVAAVLLTSFKALAAIALPFLIYVRASVYLYGHGMHPWIAILVSALLMCGVVFGGIILIARR